MRLGGRIYKKWTTPESWVEAVKASGYRAANCPLTPVADDDTIRAFADAAQRADIVIAEVGAWSNPLSSDDAVRQKALEKCKKSLLLADKIGARCCVNIAGSRGNLWSAPHPDNLSDETFRMIVDTVRGIIDTVNPSRTFYTLETMPWMYPDSPESYLRLIEAIDRPAFAVHLDPVNIINSPQRYYTNGEIIKGCFEQLGHHVKSCHAKDILLEHKLTVHLNEVRPGLGGLDYHTYLKKLDRLDPDTPLIIEHLPDETGFARAAEYIRSAAGEVGVAL